MKLYIGGAFQGQEELARRENPQANIVSGFHETVRSLALRGEDVRRFSEDFCLRNPDAVVVADEVGCGIVPLHAEDRAFREAVGRALCVIAQNAQSVTRVCCGIGVRIK